MDGLKDKFSKHKKVESYILEKLLDLWSFSSFFSANSNITSRTINTLACVRHTTTKLKQLHESCTKSDNSFPVTDRFSYGWPVKSSMNAVFFPQACKKYLTFCTWRLHLLAFHLSFSTKTLETTSRDDTFSTVQKSSVECRRLCQHQKGHEFHISKVTYWR